MRVEYLITFVYLAAIWILMYFVVPEILQDDDEEDN